jgi:AcrR family transcriptional regulator
MTTPQIKEPKQRRSREVFERIVDTALALLAERGLDTFTITAVSARAVVSVGTIYRSFGSKEQLLHYVHDRAGRMPFRPETDIGGLRHDPLRTRIVSSEFTTRHMAELLMLTRRLALRPPLASAASSNSRPAKCPRVGLAQSIDGAAYLETAPGTWARLPGVADEPPPRPTPGAAPNTGRRSPIRRGATPSFRRP